MEYMRFSQIVEKNGKTIYENNMELQHNFKVGDLVEVKYDKWHGDGACEIIHARLWIVSCRRDCDGTPLYWLSHKRLNEQMTILGIDIEDEDSRYRFPTKYAQSIFYNHIGGFSEKSLKLVEITDDLKRGVGQLTWKEDEIAQ